jgi:hypothetical protein
MVCREMMLVEVEALNGVGEVPRQMALIGKLKLDVWTMEAR